MMALGGWLKMRNLIVNFLLALILYSPAAADDTIGEGMRLSFIFQFTSLHGDFDGESEMRASSEDYLLYEMESNWGGGVAVTVVELDPKGYWDLQLSYLYSQHDASFQLLAGESELHITNLNFTCNFFRNKFFQPFLLVGWIPYAQLIINDTSNDPAAKSEETRFESICTGLNLGCGVVLNFSSHFSFTAGLTNCMLYFGEFEGGERPGIKSGLLAKSENKIKSEDFLYSQALNYYFSLGYTFR
ncbi:hypothetical protein ACFL27_16400 [candidate division CSSED10-310 bacterium]|uniref:Outer membrane protein beta-barrel domain-containing protein n=1 Tax=candidate division CSSED10-310 bacterium TaxID=2855610 RepID=A0ABV6Z0B1_UNCC1